MLTEHSLSRSQVLCRHSPVISFGPHSKPVGQVLLCHSVGEQTKAQSEVTCPISRSVHCKPGVKPRSVRLQIESVTRQGANRRWWWVGYRAQRREKHQEWVSRPTAAAPRTRWQQICGRRMDSVVVPVGLRGSRTLARLVSPGLLAPADSKLCLLLRCRGR